MHTTYGSQRQFWKKNTRTIATESTMQVWFLPKVLVFILVIQIQPSNGNVSQKLNPHLTHYGKHFVLGFTGQPSSKLRQGYNEIAISALFNTYVNISLHHSTNPLLKAKYIRAGQVLKYIIPPSMRMHSTMKDTKGILVTATEDVAVFCLNQGVGTSDSYLALPTNELGTNYIVASYPPKYGKAKLAFISPQDNTTVHITINASGFVSYGGRVYIKGQNIDVKLNKLETFHLVHHSDLSGTIIVADKAIAVLSGNTCAHVMTRFCDLIVAFLLPVEKWGTKFVVATTGIMDKKAGDIFRIFAFENFTRVRSKNGVHLLNSGNFAEYNLQNELSSFFECSKPCQVVQYTKGYSDIDPSMIIVPAINHFLNTYTVFLSGKKGDLFRHSVTLLVKTAENDGLMLNETHLKELQWKRVEGTKYSWTILQISSAVVISHSSRKVVFGLLVFGAAKYESYGYPGGFNLGIDECSTKKHNCHENASCHNAIGSFPCSCNSGFSGNGVVCEDIDECSTGGANCYGNASCTNTIGSFQCLCYSGFSGNGVRCEDIDECATRVDNCHDKASCTNTIGSFECLCNLGFSGDGVNCEDVDECLTGLNDCDDNTSCINTIGSFQCLCKSGYSGNGLSCEDIDECSKGVDNCHDNASCRNTIGSFQCLCHSGFSGNGVHCEDIDECTTRVDNCHDKASCTNMISSFQCLCNSGFSGDGVKCEDIDECATAVNNCHENATCTNTVGLFQCLCNSGFSGNGVKCEDIDECLTGVDNCHGSASCTNTIGSFECLCRSGYSGSGVNCEDIDEYLKGVDNCHDNGSCINTIGSFQCLCKSGFSGNGLNCEDIDECLKRVDNCHDNGSCMNTIGSFQCLCKSGFSGNGLNCEDIDECTTRVDNCHDEASCTNMIGSFQCLCNSGFSGDGVNCEDIDECSTGVNNCHENASCTNTIGSFQCLCNSGFSGNGVKCEDIDECLTGVDNCHGSASCTNTIGSFECLCSSGYSGSGVNCEDIDECLKGVDNCHENGSCINTIGSFQCLCKSGFSGNGLNCEDNDECSTATDKCHNYALCSNTIGSFKCLCNSGFSGNGVQCEDIDECLTGANNCNYSASCTNTIGSFQCLCNLGFSGDGLYCEDIDECSTGSYTCPGDSLCTNTIGSFQCLKPPSWSRWGSWSECTVSCNSGKQTRRRVCERNLIINGEKGCSGKSAESRTCSTWKCPDCNKVCKTGKLNKACDACVCNDNILYGKVKDNTGILLDSATIALSEFPFKILASTNISGRFEIRGLCISEDDIVVRRNGYMSQTIKTTKISPTTATVTAMLEKLVFPEVTGHPESKLRLVGQAMTLCCESETKTTTQFDWVINGRAADEYQHDAKKSSKLVIPHVSSNMSGEIKCRVYNDDGAEFSNPAKVTILNATDDSCDPIPSKQIITLPQGCTSGDRKSSTVDVGKCNEKRCIARGIKNINNCKDNFCCQPVAKDRIKVECLRHSFDLTRVTMCGCGDCTVKRSTVKGVATGGPDNIPFKYGYIYHGEKYLTRTGRKGHFSFKVPGDLTRLVVTFKDKRGYNNFQDLIKIIPLVPGRKTYVEVRMKIRPEPIIVNAKDGFEIPLGISGSIRQQYEKTEGATNSAENLTPPVSLSLPAQSLMTEEGEIYNGTAKVEVSFVDPRNATQVQEADGDFSTVDDDGEQRQLETYGVISLDFKDNSGNRLQPNTAVNVLFDLDEYNVTEKEAEEIKLWYMDEKTGRWRMMEDGLKRHKTRRSRRSGRQFYFGRIDPTRYLSINLDKLARSCYLKIKVAESNSDYAYANVNVLAIQNNLHRYLSYGVLANVATCIRTFCTDDLATIQATIDGDYLIPSENEVNEDVKRQHVIEYYRSKDIGNRFSNRITIKRLREPLSNEPSPFYSSEDLCNIGPSEYSLRFERHEYKQAVDETESFSDDWYPNEDEASVCFVKIGVYDINMCANKTASFLVQSVVGEDQVLAGQVVITLTESKSAACAEYKCPQLEDHRIVVKVVPFNTGFFDKYDSAAKEFAEETSATTHNELVYFKPVFELRKPKIGILHSAAIFLDDKGEKKEDCLKERYKAGVLFWCIE